MSVAPMMDWTDRHCRYFHRLLTRRALLYTEMVTTGALLHGDVPRHLDFIRRAPGGAAARRQRARPTSRLREAGEQWGYDEINLNCGCPSERVQRGAFGACLMAEPELVADCVKAMRDAVQDAGDGQAPHRHRPRRELRRSCAISSARWREARLQGLHRPRAQRLAEGPVARRRTARCRRCATNSCTGSSATSPSRAVGSLTEAELAAAEVFTPRRPGGCRRRADRCRGRRRTDRGRRRAASPPAPRWSWSGSRPWPRRGRRDRRDADGAAAPDARRHAGRGDPHARPAADGRRGPRRPAPAARPARQPVRVGLGLPARDADRRRAPRRERRSSTRRTSRSRRSRSTSSPSSGAMRQSRWSGRRAGCPRRPVRLPVRDGARALRARRRRGRHQPLSRRQRPHRSTAPAAARGPWATAVSDRPASARSPAELERAMERRAARARGAAPGAGRAEAGAGRPAQPSARRPTSGRRPAMARRSPRPTRSRPDRPLQGPRHAQAGGLEGTGAKAAAKPTGDPQAGGGGRDGRGGATADGRRCGRRRTPPAKPASEAAGDAQAGGAKAATATLRSTAMVDADGDVACRAEAPHDAQGGGPGRTRLRSAGHGRGPDPGTGGRARARSPRWSAARPRMRCCSSDPTGSARRRSRSTSRPGCCAPPRRPSGRAGRAGPVGWSSTAIIPTSTGSGRSGPAARSSSAVRMPSTAASRTSSASWR